MTGRQYEELCRYFVAEQLGLALDAVQSVFVPNPTRHAETWHTHVRAYRHQIDLYWETFEWLTRCLNIANAKWRTSGKVGLQDVLLLQQVRVKVGAHKAVLITNAGYSEIARRAAADEGIGLLIVRPEFDSRALIAGKRHSIQEQFVKLHAAQPRLYSYAVVQKGAEPASSPAALLGITAPPAVGMSDARRIPLGAPAASCNTSGQSAGSSPAGEALGSYSTRQGPGPGYRAK